MIEQVCDHFGIPRDVPWKKLPARARRRSSSRARDETLTIQRTIEGKRLRARTSERRRWEGVIPILDEGRTRACAARRPRPTWRRRACAACGGSRLRKEALAGALPRTGRSPTSARMTVADARGVPARRAARRPRGGDRRADPPRARSAALKFLEDVGLGYLALDRGTGVALGRRVAAHPARDAGRVEPARHPLRARRAVDRPPPARQPPPDRDARAPARRRATP